MDSIGCVLRFVRYVLFISTSVFKVLFHDFWSSYFRFRVQIKDFFFFNSQREFKAFSMIFAVEIAFRIM